MAGICVLAPDTWGRRVAQHPIKSPAKLMNGANLMLIVIFGRFTADYRNIQCPRNSQCPRNVRESQE